MTSPGPLIRPCPRTRIPPLPVNRSTAALSSQSSVAVGADPAGHRGPVGIDARRARHPVDPVPFHDQVGGADHHLGRDAAPVRAFAADEPVFHLSHHQARFSQRVRGPFSHRAPCRSRQRPRRDHVPSCSLPARRIRVPGYDRGNAGRGKPVDAWNAPGDSHRHGRGSPMRSSRSGAARSATGPPGAEPSSVTESDDPFCGLPARTAGRGAPD